MKLENAQCPEITSLTMIAIHKITTPTKKTVAISSLLSRAGRDLGGGRTASSSRTSGGAASASRSPVDIRVVRLRMRALVGGNDESGGAGACWGGNVRIVNGGCCGGRGSLILSLA